MSLPATTVKIAFDLAAAGNGDFFTLSDTVKGVLGGTVYTLAGDVLVDVTDDVRSVSVTRGRSRELERFNAGQASVVLNNQHRWYDPTVGTAISPYSGSILPRKQVVIESAGEQVFAGQVEDWALDYDLSGDATATVQAADGFALLAGQQLTAGTTTSQLSGARVNAILSRPEVAWPDGRRDIDTGSATIQADTLADNTNVLQYLQRIEQAEFGALFIDRYGVLAFRERSGNQEPSGSLAFADDGAVDAIPFSSIELEYGTESLYNDVTITRANGGTVTASGTASQATYGISALSISDILLNTDDAAQDLADFLVGRYGVPELRVNSVTVDLAGLTEAQQAAVLALDLFDFVRVRYTPNGIGDAISAAVSIDSIKHDMNPANHRVTFTFSETLSAFVLDSNDYGVLDTNILGF